jgi:hypothetical protein
VLARASRPEAWFCIIRFIVKSFRGDDFMSMQESGGRVGDALAGQIPVSKDNPCPFLRALVVGGYVDGHIVPLPTISRTIEAASGERGLKKPLVRVQTFLVALIANGLSPARLWRSLQSGAELDRLRVGPLDKLGGGSRILDAEAHVRDDQLDRLADFGRDVENPDGGTERGLNAAQVSAYMKANLARNKQGRRWYHPMLMQGEWPVLLKIMGKGAGDHRYLSVDEVRTLFKAREFPTRIVERLRAKV